MNIFKLLRCNLSVGVLALLTLACCGAAAAQETCSATGEDYIRDPAFATLFNSGKTRKWQISQHGAGKSFEFAVDEEAQTITSIGTQPWTLVTQSLDASLLAGNSVRFSAEIKLNLTAPIQAHGFKLGGGLTVTAKKEGRVVLYSVFEHEPHMGDTDWLPVSVILKIPAGTSYLRVGVMQQAGGKMQLRKPSLRLLDSSTGSCAATTVK